MEDLFMLWIQGGAWSLLLLSFSALKLCSFILPFLFYLSNCESGLGPSLCRGVGKLLFSGGLAVPVHSLDLIYCGYWQWQPHRSGFLLSSCEAPFGNCSSIQGRDSYLELCTLVFGGTIHSSGNRQHFLKDAFLLIIIN